MIEPKTDYEKLLRESPYEFIDSAVDRYPSADSGDVFHNGDHVIAVHLNRPDRLDDYCVCYYSEDAPRSRQAAVRAVYEGLVHENLLQLGGAT